MASLSLAMIVRNEEETIERVLRDAKQVCEQMIVVDTGSTDDTVKLAKGMGAKVHHFEWIDDFSAARNYAFGRCTKDWILWLDADDVIPESEIHKLRALKAELSDNIDAVLLNWQWGFDTAGHCTNEFPRERLLRRAAGLRWEYPVHECIAYPFGRFWERLEISIRHMPLPHRGPLKKDRNLKLLERAVYENGDRRPRNLFYLANEHRDHGQWQKALDVYADYLEVSNLPWEKYSAYMSCMTCHYHLGQPELGLRMAVEAMLLDSTRPDAFNQLGLYHYHRKEWKRAIAYFTAASACPRPTEGFCDPANYTWMPHDYLGVCYSNLGENLKSLECSLKAMANNPDQPRVRRNLHWSVDQL